MSYDWTLHCVLHYTTRSLADVLLYCADEGDSAALRFLHEFGQDVSLPLHPKASTALSAEHDAEIPPIVIFRLSDESGTPEFEKILPPYSKASLSSDDVFLVDAASNSSHPAIYIWIGRNASLNEKRLALQYAQRYLYHKRSNEGSGFRVDVGIPIIKLLEGNETADFLRATQG